MFRFLGYLFDRNMLQPRPYQAQRYDGHIGENRQLDPGHRCRLHADAQNLGNARSLRITVREFPGVSGVISSVRNPHRNAARTGRFVFKVLWVAGFL